MTQGVKRRFHRQRDVRLHASGKWVCTIGRVWSPKKSKLVDKDWYFDGTKEDATEKANAKARQWELLCTNWERTEQPAMEILGEPLPKEPRWSTGVKTPRKKYTAEQLAAFNKHPVDRETMAVALAECEFNEVVNHYERARRKDVDEGEIELSTLAKELSQMRQVAKALPSDIPAIHLEAEHFKEAKSKLLESHRRRTVRNYLSAGVKLLQWLYGEYGGKEKRIPGGIDKAITLRKSTNLEITTHSISELKDLVARTAGSISQLDLMLALNCGMYQEDIGRLRRDELDLNEGSVFWSRQKEPANAFRLHHVFWPETLRLVDRYLNDGRDDEVFLDHRIQRGKPSEIHTRDLAFLDKGRPRYTIKPSGSHYDRVGRRWSALKIGVNFRNLRKSTSDLITSVVEETLDLKDRADLADVLQKRFLGQKTDELVRLYRKVRRGAYRQMNTYLKMVGEQLRAAKVFERVDV